MTTRPVSRGGHDPAERRTKSDSAADIRGLKIRSATESDLEGILEIFNHEIVNDVKAWETEPVEGPAREKWFEAHSRPAHPLLVAQRGSGEIVGWASLSRWAPHAAYGRTVEVSIYVHRNARGQGIGRRLLGALIERARELDHHVLVARTVASNEASRRLHLGAGFRSIGVMHEVGLKFGSFLDAELFELVLD